MATALARPACDGTVPRSVTTWLLVSTSMSLPSSASTPRKLDFTFVVIHHDHPGLLVGVGTRLGNGCTSGHGISGTLQLSVGSWIAVINETVLFGGGGQLKVVT